MLHQGIRQILPYAYSWQISQGDIPQGFDYYALGHFHTRILQRFGGGTLGVAGSPDIIREDEIEGYKSQGKGAFLVDLSSSEPSVQKMKVDIRPQEIVQIKAENYKEEIDKLMNEIPVKFKGPKKPILHVKVDGNSNKGLMSYISKLQEVVLHYKLEFLLQNLKSGDVVIPSNSTIDELISKFLEGKGYSREEVELILGMFKDIDNEENVKSSLRKVGGVPQ
jgi:exonuclease SbcD